jgi:hypothetical protein
VSEQLALGSDKDAAEAHVAAKSASAKAPSGSKPTFLWLIRDHQVGRLHCTALHCRITHSLRRLPIAASNLTGLRFLLVRLS